MSQPSAPALRFEGRPSWAGDPPHRSAARERLLDATERCIVRGGLGAALVAAVASEAGVSRPTVYRYFDDRHALIFATLVRAGRTLAAALDEQLQGVADPAEKAVAAELFVLREVGRNPLFSQVWNSTLIDSAMLADVTHPAIIEVARAGLASLEAAAGWSEAEASEAVEWMLRTLLSMLLAPAPKRSEVELHSFLERRLVPALGLDANPGR
jgi:AcrR family transcriptional regulator